MTRRRFADWKSVLGGMAVMLAFSILTEMQIACAQQSVAKVDWSAWKFLIGEWVGEGTGKPGEGIGGFSLLPDLQNAVLVRKNYAEYPATKDRAAFRHDDLMIIYNEDGRTKAVYFDNEKRVIHYTVQFASDSSSIVFVGDITPNSPRFRFAYTGVNDGTLKIMFETAPPGKPEAFTRYIEGTAHRKK